MSLCERGLDKKALRRERSGTPRKLFSPCNRLHYGRTSDATPTLFAPGSRKGDTMRRLLPVLALLVAGTGSAHARGLLIPEEKNLPPLALLNHQVHIAIDDQVAVTRVEQTFRNHTDRPLEATYIFPVPKGASVNRFTMWVDGKETRGEMVEAQKARAVYEGIVRRTQDPGLLEYLGNDLLRLRVFPVPARG